MKKYFEKQLEETPKLITEENVEAIQVSPKYTHFKVGDQICLYIEETEKDDDGVKTTLSIITPIKVGDIDTLKNDYTFVRMEANIPILRKK